MRLDGLAWDEAPRPLTNILLQAIPSETFHDKANGGFCAWMDVAMSGAFSKQACCGLGIFQIAVTTDTFLNIELTKQKPSIRKEFLYIFMFCLIFVQNYHFGLVTGVVHQVRFPKAINEDDNLHWKLCSLKRDVA